MAWYRAGGGGIPSSIKTDMNAVLNKKFGTSTDYPPTDWAPSVNLLGPLPEKTASGAVASITDGADGVPLKNWGVTVDANLSGVSAVECTQTKKNLIDNSAAAWENGTINASGNNASGTGTRTIGYFELKGGATITVSGIVAPATTSDFRIFCYDENKDFLSYRNYSASYIVPDDVRYIRIRNVSVADISALQIEYGSTATTYEPYSAPVDNTVTLGQTIYGGSVDVVNGTGTDGYNKITLSSLLTDLSVAQIGTTGVYRIRFSLADAKGAVNSAVFNGLCDYYTPLSANQTYNKNDGISINTSGQCYIYDSRFNTSTSLNDFKTWIDANPVNLCYELATGTDFTFTPITPTPETPLGASNFWADTGDSTVTYRADISLLLGGN